MGTSDEDLVQLTRVLRAPPGKVFAAWTDPALLERETFELVVQVNGRVRGRVEVPAGLDEDELVARAKELPRVAAHLDGKQVKNAIVVPGRLVNLVV